MLLLEVVVGRARGGGWVEQSSDVIRRAALGPLPCQLSPGGDDAGAQDLGGVMVMMGVKEGDSGQRSKQAGVTN